MKYRYCEYCGNEISLDRNMNCKYCCNECYKENKKDIAVIINRQRKEERILIRNDEEIHGLYENYGSDIMVSAKELLDKDFNWNIYSEIKEIESIKVKILLRYGYTLFNNQTVKLWKL